MKAWQIAIVTLLTLLLLALVASACVVWCHYTGYAPILFIGENNIGNQIASYGTSLQHCFARGRDFRCSVIVVAKGSRSHVRHFDQKISLKNSGYIPGLWAKEKVRHIGHVGSWNNPCFWQAIRAPLTTQIEAHLPALTPEDAQLARNAAVLHFRCSDTPFIRAYEYNFMKYRWWSRALKQCPDGITHCIVLFCYQHRADPELAGAARRYFDDWLRFLQTTEGPKRGMTFSHRCGSSSEADFQLMRHARFLVSPGSTFSWAAAITGHQERAVILRGYDRLDEQDAAGWPKHVRELSRELILRHEDVPDYCDVPSVLSLLRT